MSKRTALSRAPVHTFKTSQRFQANLKIAPIIRSRLRENQKYAEEQEHFDDR